MTAQALLAAHAAKRKHPRYILKRRGLMAANEVAIQVRTLDVSVQGFGVIAPEPIHIGKIYSISFDIMVRERIVPFHFPCTAVYCILSGVDGFRIGLHIDDDDAHKLQLQKIIATCPTPAG